MTNMVVPPSDVQAEQAVIGAMLNRPDCIPGFKSALDSSDFYREAHRVIVDALYSLQDVDILLVKQALEHSGKLEQAGGVGYLMEVSDAVIITAGTDVHAQHLKSLSTQRKIISMCQEAISSCVATQAEPESILAGVKEWVRWIESNQTGRPYTPNKQLVDAVYKDIERRQKMGDALVGISTGFQHIDDACQGLEPSTTVYLIARPSIGKTAVALQIADYVAAHTAGRRVLFFSLESSATALTRRRLSAMSNVYLSRIRTGNIEDDQWGHLQKAANAASADSPIIVEHPRFKTVESLVAFAESAAMDHPISLIVVDHIQRMRSQKQKQSRHLEISHVSEELSSLSKQLNCPVLILCQLNREIEKRAGKNHPQLADMKESGDLEANADMVWGLWRKDRDADFARLECLKGRDTGTWVRWLRFDRFIQRFYEAVEPNDYGTATETRDGYGG